MYNAEYFIEQLKMTAHVEGGYFKECLVSDEKRWSSIYFLLRKGEASHFHRLKSDEVWYYHAGEPLTIYMIDELGCLVQKQLGMNIEKGEMPQILVPRGTVFGSMQNEEGFSLVGCMVAPAFTYDEFELFERADLLSRYPQHEDIIMKLTR